MVQTVLIELYKELYPFLKDTELKEGKELYQDACHLNDKDQGEIQEILDKFDFFIRLHLHKKGLLMAKGDDPGNAMRS